MLCLGAEKLLTDFCPQNCYAIGSTAGHQDATIVAALKWLAALQCIHLTTGPLSVSRQAGDKDAYLWCGPTQPPLVPASQDHYCQAQPAQEPPHCADCLPSPSHLLSLPDARTAIIGIFTAQMSLGN